MLRALLLALLAGAQTGLPQRDAAAVPSSTPASVSGRITERESGRPIARAVVTLTPADRSRYLQTVADHEGRYAFTALAPGRYALVAGPPELHATHLRAVFGESGPEDPYGFPNAHLELNPGDTRTGADLALARALAIEGRVGDELGEPLADVELQLRRADGTHVPVQVHSDDRGEYRLFGLATGRYRVCAFPRSRFSNAPSEDGTLFVRTCHPGSLHESGASDVVLTTHDATGIDIRVQRSRAYSLSGSVRSASGGAVDGAIVVAHDVDERRGGGSARTGDGGFELRGLLPGRYLVTATACQSREPERPIPGCEPEAGFAEVDVAGDMSGLVIAMAKPRTAAGRVVFEGAPAPPPGALNLVVQTRPPRRLSRAVPSRPPYATVEENLSFVLRDLYDVPLAVGVQGLPDGWAVKAVRSEGRDITDIAVDFRGIREDQPIEVVLTNRVARPVVRVTDEEGRPVKSFRTAVLPADPAKWNTASWFPAEEPVGEGGMRIGPLAPGDYLVAALRPADVPLVGQEPERITHVAPAAIRVTLTEGDTRTLDLQLARLPAEAR